MDEVFRVGIKGGLAHTLRGDISAYDHVVEVIESDDPAAAASQGSYRRSVRETFGCSNRDKSSIVDRHLIVSQAGERTIAKVLHVDSCMHATFIVITTGPLLVNWVHGTPRVSARDVLNLATYCAVRTDDEIEPTAMASRFSDELKINLSAALRAGTTSLSELLAPSSRDQDILDLAQRRSALGEVEEYAISVMVAQSDLALVRSEVEQANAALQTATALQTYKLIASNIELAEAARKADAAQVNRERRWARVGAATLFPLLFLSLLGANTVPTSISGHSMQTLTTFLISIGLTVLIAVAGYGWANRRKVPKSNAHH